MRRLSMFALACIMLQPLLAPQAEGEEKQVDLGRELSFNTAKGNCLACHRIQGGEQPGNFGPPLIQMKLRYPDRDVLYKQIWDATEANPKSIMPPFGKHGILTDEEVDAVVDYMYTL